VEPKEAKLQLSLACGVDANLKLGRSSFTLFLTEASASLTVFAISYYCFINNNLYAYLLTVLNQLYLPPHLTPLILPSILISVVFILTLTGAFTKICRLSLVLLFPSILWFSDIDWLQILNSPVSLQFFKTQIPSTYILSAGLLLISTEILLHFLQHAEKTRSELLRRGAERRDVEKTTTKQFVFALTLTALSTLIAVTTASAALFLKVALLNITTQMPYPHITLGTIAAVILFTSILAYLKATGAYTQTSSQKRQRSTLIEWEKQQTR
jgi:hypothetical protein